MIRFFLPPFSAVATLLTRAAATGDIRPDITPEHIVRTTVGLRYTHDRPGWRPNVHRFLDIFLDGIRSH